MHQVQQEEGELLCRHLSVCVTRVGPALGQSQSRSPCWVIGRSASASWQEVHIGDSQALVC